MCVRRLLCAKWHKGALVGVEIAIDFAAIIGPPSPTHPLRLRRPSTAGLRAAHGNEQGPGSNWGSYATLRKLGPHGLGQHGRQLLHHTTQVNVHSVLQARTRVETGQHPSRSQASACASARGTESRGAAVPG